jgi:hypothetical protein
MVDSELTELLLVSYSHWLLKSTYLLLSIVMLNTVTHSFLLHFQEEAKYTMHLTINKISDADEGDYFCHAENAFGSGTQPVSVRIRNVVSIILLLLKKIIPCCFV